MRLVAVVTIAMVTVVSGCTAAPATRPAASDEEADVIATFVLLTSTTGSIEATIAGEPAGGMAMVALFDTSDGETFSFAVASPHHLGSGMETTLSTSGDKALLVVVTGTKRPYTIDIASQANQVRFKSLAADLSAWTSTALEGETSTRIWAWNMQSSGLDPQDPVWSGDFLLSASHEAADRSLSALFWSARESTAQARATMTLDAFGQTMEDEGEVSPLAYALGHRLATGTGSVALDFAYRGTSTPPFLDVHLFTAPLPAGVNWTFN